MFVIEEELKKLPQKPGVYLMHDAQDNIIYVGKAIRLRSRVQSYFREKINRGPQIEKMVTQIARFEYIVTDSELEALVLENNLIKEHNPKYNTLLKDDKTYPYIKVTVGEAYPRVQFSRLMKKDKSKYFGPFTSAAAVKDTIELLNKLFKLRTCNRVLPRDCGLERPCLNYHIGQCMAPCQDYVSREEYRAHVDKALEFLNGNYNMILNDLQKKMEEAAVSYDSIICEKKCPLSLSPLNTKFYRYKEDFDKCEMMDFEFLKIPVPVNYHAILSRTYGDYMKFVIGTSLHGNVFFDTDKSYTEYTNR